MNPRTQTVSLSLHLIAVVFGLLLPSALFPPAAPTSAERQTHRISPQTLLWRPESLRASGGAGPDLRPATRGAVPQVVRPVFIPPAMQRVERPQLILDSGVDTVVPRIDLAVLGDPFSKVAGLPSGGFGNQGGLGNQGDGGKVGDGNEAGGTLGARKVLGATPPAVLYKVEPEYADEARKAKLQGTVLVAVDIDERGAVSRVRVLQPLGLGSDEKAVEAVQRWRFKPAMKDGKPVRYPAAIEVRFQLL